MNWLAVTWVALIACVIATVVVFAATMAYLEHGPERVAALLAIPTLALAVADALLIGLVA
jgi:hypothetical protein